MCAMRAAARISRGGIRSAFSGVGYSGLVVLDAATVTAYGAVQTGELEGKPLTGKLVIVRESQMKKFVAGKRLEPIQIPQSAVGAYLRSSDQLGFLKPTMVAPRLKRPKFPPLAAVPAKPAEAPAYKVSFTGGRRAFGRQFYPLCAPVRFAISGLAPSTAFLADAPLAMRRMSGHTTSNGVAIVDLGPQCRLGSHTITVRLAPVQGSGKVNSVRDVLVGYTVRVGARRFFATR